MDIYSIYKATNTINGKVYIGYTKNLIKRIARHKLCSKSNDSKFYRAIRKYGWNSFEWEVIYQSIDMEHTKNLMESKFIQQFDSYNTGYNSTNGGEGMSGFSRKQTSEEKSKRRILMLGNKLGKFHKNIPLSEAHKLALRKPKSKITPKTESHKLKIGESNRGKIREVVQCPHCSKQGGKPAMYRFHFSNCSESIPPV